MELLLPYAEGGRLSELHELAGEMEREDTPEGVRVRARVPAAAAARFERFASNGAVGQRLVGLSELRFRRLSAEAAPPERSHDDDAGYDLRACEAACSGPASAPAWAPASRWRSPRASAGWCCRARGWRPGTASRW